MTSTIRSELRKLRTTKMAATLAAVALGLVALGLALSTSGNAEINGRTDPTYLLLGSVSFAAPIALILGIMIGTNDQRHRTVGPALLATPDRGRLMAAKFVVAGAAGLVLGLVSLAFAAAVGIPWFSSQDMAVELGATGPWLSAAGWVAGLGLWAVLGAGLGALIGNQWVAIVGGLVYLFVVDQVIGGIAPDLNAYLVAGAASALGRSATPEALPMATGAAVFAAWAAVAALLGAGAFRGRDVQ